MSKKTTTWDPKPLVDTLRAAVDAAESGDADTVIDLGKRARATCPDGFSAVYADRVTYAGIRMKYDGASAWGVRRAARLTEAAAGLPASVPLSAPRT